MSNSQWAPEDWVGITPEGSRMIELQPGERLEALPFIRAEEALAIWRDLRQQSGARSAAGALSSYERYLHDCACLYLGAALAPAGEAEVDGLAQSLHEAAQTVEALRATIEKQAKDLAAAQEDRSSAYIKIDEQAREIWRLTDRIDLQHDEFKRIRVCPAADDEIRSLCDRAVKQVEQHVPVVVQRDQAEAAAKRLEARVLQLEAELAGSKRQLDVMQIFPANGIGAFARERLRQVNVEGYSPEHDARHVNGEIALAAAAYAVPADDKGRRSAVLADLWPWAWEHWKPAPEDRLREIEKAGALLAAEWDRIDRARLRARVDAMTAAPRDTLAAETAAGEPGASGGPSS